MISSQIARPAARMMAKRAVPVATKGATQSVTPKAAKAVVAAGFPEFPAITPLQMLWGTVLVIGQKIKGVFKKPPRPIRDL